MDEPTRSARLGDVATLEYGRALKEDDRDGGDHAVMSSAGRVGSHSIALTPDGPAIVIGRKGTAGSVHWSERPCWPIDTAFWVADLDPTVSLRYLYYVLLHANLPLLSAQTGVPGLSRDRAYEVAVPLRSREAQDRITSLIDRAKAAGRRAGELGHLLEQLASAVVDTTFQRVGASIPLGEVASVKGGKRLPKGTPWATDLTGHPYIRVVDLGGGRIDTAHLAQVPPDVVDRIANYRVRAGDIVLSIVGTIGEVALVPRDLDEANLTENAARIRVESDTIDPEFVVAFLRSTAGRAQVERLTVGTTQRKLALFRIETIELPDVDLETQLSVSALLRTISDLLERTQRYEVALSEVERALLDDLLSGRHEIPESYDALLDEVAT